jgi:hypothetical protein
MLLCLDSEKEPWRAARKYDDCETKSDVWMWKGVRLGPMRSLLVAVKSEALALERYEFVIAIVC